MKHSFVFWNVHIEMGQYPLTFYLFIYRKCTSLEGTPEHNSESEFVSG
jgi:hypothetical protein